MSVSRWNSEGKMFVIVVAVLCHSVTFSSSSPHFGIDPNFQNNHGVSSKLMTMFPHQFPAVKRINPTSDLSSRQASNLVVSSYNINHPNEVGLENKEKAFEVDDTKAHLLFEEVSWRKCSAKRLTAYLHSDVKIRCEFWAPLGTNVTWYKNGEIKAIQPHHEFHKQELISMKFFGVDLPEDKLSARRKYEFHLASYFYIPCMSEDYQGDYKIEVEVPNGKTFTRNFELSAYGHSPFYSICMHGPIIVDFAKSIIGKEGEELYIPCRPNNYYMVAIVWKREDRQLTKDNYSITDYGDLFIKNLTALDEGYFICELYYTSYDLKYDDMATFIKVLD